MVSLFKQLDSMNFWTLFASRETQRTNMEWWEASLMFLWTHIWGTWSTQICTRRSRNFKRGFSRTTSITSLKWPFTGIALNKQQIITLREITCSLTLLIRASIGNAMMRWLRKTWSSIWKTQILIRSEMLKISILCHHNSIGFMKDRRLIWKSLKN